MFYMQIMVESKKMPFFVYRLIFGTDVLVFENDLQLIFLYSFFQNDYDNWGFWEYCKIVKKIYIVSGPCHVLTIVV